MPIVFGKPFDPLLKSPHCSLPTDGYLFRLPSQDRYSHLDCGRMKRSEGTFPGRRVAPRRVASFRFASSRRLSSAKCALHCLAIHHSITYFRFVQSALTHSLTRVEFIVSKSWLVFFLCVRTGPRTPARPPETLSARVEIVFLSRPGCKLLCVAASSMPK